MYTFDLMIAGGGAAGLWTAYYASQLGLRVALLDNAPQFSSAATIRNEGWAHFGTYHSYAVADFDEAQRVASRCQYGFQQMQHFCPEAFNYLEKTYAVLKDNTRLEPLLERWEEANVPYKCVSKSKIEKLFPTSRLSDEWSFFETSDKGVDTCLLGTKLVVSCRASGVKMLTNACIQSVNGQRVSYQVNGETKTVHARVIVYTVGAQAGILHQKLYGSTLPIRLWKSHLLITPRVAKHSLYCLDPGEMTMINHGERSIFGFNDDARLMTSPNYEIDELAIKQGVAAIDKTIDIGRSDFISVSCMKVDLAKVEGCARSLDIGIEEVHPNHFFAFPGKMTEAPYLASQMTRLIFDRVKPMQVATRPVDKGFALSKQGVEVVNGMIVKPVQNLEAGLREIAVAKAFSSNPKRPVTVVESQAVRQDPRGWMLTMPLIAGGAVSRCPSYESMRVLVKDLASFHATFVSPSEAMVLYRDAILSNYLETAESKFVHIDFSSSNKFVHAFDDLSLLLCSSWVDLQPMQVDKLVTEYLKARKEILSTTKFDLGLKMTVSPLSYYRNSILEMQKNGVESRNLIKFLDQINFEHLLEDMNGYGPKKPCETK